MIRSIEGGINVTGSTYIGSLECNTRNNLDPGFETDIQVNPMNPKAFPKLAIWASNYSKYSLKHSHLEWQPIVGNVASGTVYMYPQYDMEATRDTDDLEALNNGRCFSGPVALKHQFPAFNPNLQSYKLYDIPDDYQNTALKTEVPVRYRVGTFACGNAIGQVGATNLGQAGRLIHHFSMDLLQEDSSLLKRARTSGIWKTLGMTKSDTEDPVLSSGVLQVNDIKGVGVTMLTSQASTFVQDNGVVVPQNGALYFVNPGKYVMTLYLAEDQLLGPSPSGFSNNVDNWKWKFLEPDLNSKFSKSGNNSIIVALSVNVGEVLQEVANKIYYTASYYFNITDTSVGFTWASHPCNPGANFAGYEMTVFMNPGPSLPNSLFT